MSELAILQMVSGGLEVAFWLAAPLAGIALAIGLVASLVQTATSVHEPNVSFLPKLVGVALAGTILGPKLLEQLVQYTTALLSDFSRFIH